MLLRAVKVSSRRTKKEVVAMSHENTPSVTRRSLLRLLVLLVGICVLVGLVGVVVGRHLSIPRGGDCRRDYIHRGARTVGGREVARASQPGPEAIGSDTHGDVDELLRTPFGRTCENTPAC
jgi:hypothetical protein